MLGILVELALSWVIVWIAKKKNLNVLGLMPTWPRLRGFGIFFLVATFCCLLEIILRIACFKEHYSINPKLTLALFAEGLWWNIKSVLYEELIFRGVLLYILIRRLGAMKAIWISAIAFGVYHWFSFNLVGNVSAMIYVFIVTGIIGLLLAYSYAKILSLYIAIGFHLGWNFMRGFVFSQGPLGDGVFVVSKRAETTISYFTYYAVTIAPMVVTFLSSYFILRKWKTVR